MFDARLARAGMGLSADKSEIARGSLSKMPLWICAPLVAPARLVFSRRGRAPCGLHARPPKKNAASEKAAPTAILPEN